MSLSVLRSYARGVFAHIPWEHWAVIGVFSFALTVFLVIRKKCLVYSAICFGFTVFLSMLLLDVAVVTRLIDSVHLESGFSLTSEYHRLIRGSNARKTDVLANIVAYIPFGFFLIESISSMKQSCSWWLIGCGALASFGLSLFIESLQLFFHLGVFEITDLVSNSLGGFVGASFAIIGRALLVRLKKSE